MERVVLGSRGSALALAQVELVKAALRNAHPALPVEVKIVTTSGDRRIDPQPVDSAGLKGMFTREIQEALLSGEIDAAIHSLKDLPGHTPPALALAAVLPRADTADLLIAKTPRGLFPGARIGTESVRRRRQLLWKHPGLVVTGLRGNVPTRLRKLAENDALDAIVLARAGLERLGYEIANGEMQCEAGRFQASEINMLPAIGQGAIGIEIRAGDSRVKEISAAIDHVPTHLCIRAERELLRLLDGDCQLPVGMRATLRGAEISAAAIVFHAEDAPPAHAEATGPSSDPEGLAFLLFERLSA